MLSLFAVTAAEYRLAGLHGGLIVGAVVLALVIGIVWHRRKKPYYCTSCLRWLPQAEVREEFDLGLRYLSLGFTCRKCFGEAVSREEYEENFGGGGAR